jgi:hypothetical protein
MSTTRECLIGKIQDTPLLRQSGAHFDLIYVLRMLTKFGFVLMFVGYSSLDKGYICLYISISGVYVSCNVVYNKSFFPSPNT